MIRPDSAAIIQCHANIVAGLKYHGFPLPTDIVAAQWERNLFRPDSAFLQVLYTLVHLTLPAVFSPDIGNYKRFHGPTAVGSWRECVAFTSMHMILFSNSIVEVHYDLCNPDGGVAPAIGHGLECLWPGPTNPWRVAKGLRRRGIDVALVPKGTLET